MTTDDEARHIAKEELHALLFQLGYDIRTPGGLQKLAKDLEWASEKRQQEIRRSANVSRAIWLAVTTFLGSAVTVAAEKLLK